MEPPIFHASNRIIERQHTEAAHYLFSAIATTNTRVAVSHQSVIQVLRYTSGA